MCLVWNVRYPWLELRNGTPLWAFSRLARSWCVWDMSLFGLTHTRLRINPLASSAAKLWQDSCDPKGGLDVIRKEAWPFYRTIFGDRLYWVLEEPKGPKASMLSLQSFLRQGVSLGYVGRIQTWSTLRTCTTKSTVLSTEGRVVGLCREN